MPARDAKIFLLEIEFKTQGKLTSKDHSSMKHGALDFSKGVIVHAFEHSVESQFDHGSGQARGRRSHKPFKFIREVDSASPQFWQALCTNEAYKTAKLSAVRPGGDGKLALFHSFTLENGLCVLYRQFHGMLEGSGEKSQIHTDELEEIQLTYDKITFSVDKHSKSATDSWSAQT